MTIEELNTKRQYLRTRINYRNRHGKDIGEDVKKYNEMLGEMERMGMAGAREKFALDEQALKERFGYKKDDLPRPPGRKKENEMLPARREEAKKEEAKPAAAPSKSLYSFNISCEGDRVDRNLFGVLDEYLRYTIKALGQSVEESTGDDSRDDEIAMKYTILLSQDEYNTISNTLLFLREHAGEGDEDEYDPIEIYSYKIGK